MILRLRKNDVLFLHLGVALRMKQLLEKIRSYEYVISFQLRLLFNTRAYVKLSDDQLSKRHTNG